MSTGEINQYVGSDPLGGVRGELTCPLIDHLTPEGGAGLVISLPVCGGRIGGRDIPPIP